MYELYSYARPLGATDSIAGAGWTAAGYLSVIIWAGLFGAIFGWSYRAYVRSSGGIAPTLAYMTMAAISPIMYRDGSVISILKNVQFYFIPIIALMVVSYYLTNSGRAAQSISLQTGTSGSVTAKDRRLARATGASIAPQTTNLSTGDDNTVAIAKLGSPSGRRSARAADLW